MLNLSTVVLAFLVSTAIAATLRDGTQQSDDRNDRKSEEGTTLRPEHSSAAPPRPELSSVAPRPAEIRVVPKPKEDREELNRTESAENSTAAPEKREEKPKAQDQQAHGAGKSDSVAAPTHQAEAVKLGDAPKPIQQDGQKAATPTEKMGQDAVSAQATPTTGQQDASNPAPAGPTTQDAVRLPEKKERVDEITTMKPMKEERNESESLSQPLEKREQVRVDKEDRHDNSTSELEPAKPKVNDEKKEGEKKADLAPERKPEAEIKEHLTTQAPEQTTRKD